MSSRGAAAPRTTPSQAAATLALICAGAFAGAAAARAAEWIERPYDPPVGSHWRIRLDTSTEENRDGRAQKTARAMTSELTIEEKLTDGFRVTFVVRKADYQGDQRTAALVEPLNKLFENLVVRGTTGANGTPLHVDNLGEMEATAHAAIDRLAAALPSQAAADVLRRLANQMLVVDEKQAAKIYLSSLATLALGQNTGLHPGETRHEIGDAPNPFGGAPIKSNTTFAIDSADPTTGKVHFVRTAAFDPEAIRDFLSNLAQRLGGGDGSQKLDDLLSQFAITLDSRTDIEVEDGMTRSIRQDDAATATFRGQTTVKRAHKLMTVAPAP
jgi:hypothetical protein